MSGRGYKNTPQMDASLDLVAHGNHPSQLRLNFAEEAAAERQQKYRDFVQHGIDANNKIAYLNTQRAEKPSTSLHGSHVQQQSIPIFQHPQALHIPFQHTPLFNNPAFPEHNGGQLPSPQYSQSINEQDHHGLPQFQRNLYVTAPVTNQQLGQQVPIHVAPVFNHQPISGTQYSSGQSDVHSSADKNSKRNCNTYRQRNVPYLIPHHQWEQQYGATVNIQSGEPMQRQYPTVQQQQFYPPTQPAHFGMIFNGNASITHSTVVVPVHNEARVTPIVIGDNNITNSTIFFPTGMGTRGLPMVNGNNNICNVDSIIPISRLGETRDSPIVIDESNNTTINLENLTCGSTTTIDNQGADRFNDRYNDRYPYGLQNYIKIMGRNHETDALEKAIAEGKISAPINNAFKAEGKDQVLNQINYEELLHGEGPSIPYSPLI